MIWLAVYFVIGTLVGIWVIRKWDDHWTKWIAGYAAQFLWPLLVVLILFAAIEGGDYHDA